MADVIGHGPRRPRRPPPRWLVTVAAVVAVLGLSAAGLRAAHTGGRGDAGSTPRHTPSGRASRPVPTPPGVTEVGHALLPGAHAGWQLFARTGKALAGRGRVVRLQLAAGRITRTRFPDVRSGGPVSFVAGPQQAIVRPLDYVPGYVVPDGKPARRLTGPLDHGGPAIRGPKPGQVWVPSRRRDHRMRLVTLDGTPTGVLVRASSGSRTTAGVRSDGAGYLLTYTDHGVYDVRPAGWRRVTTGRLLAVGPTRWLVRACAHGRCGLRVIDRRTGRHRRLGRAPYPRPAHKSRYGVGGVISPDGGTAALVREHSDGTATLHLLALATGADDRTCVSTPANMSLSRGGLVWSPDSSRLFTINANRHVTAVNPRTGRIDMVAPDLPPVAQLAFRDARSP